MFRSILIASALALTACTTVTDEDPEVAEAAAEEAVAEEAVVEEETMVEEAAAVESADVIATAMARDNLSTLAMAIEAAEIGDALSGPGPFTLFAPTDAAFAAVPGELRQALMQPENRDRLPFLLGYHVVPGRATSSELAGQQGTATTAVGVPLTIDATGPGIRVDGANIIAADIEASTGVVHIIDRVLVPQVSPES